MHDPCLPAGQALARWWHVVRLPRLAAAFAYLAALARSDPVHTFLTVR